MEFLIINFLSLNNSSVVLGEIVLILRKCIVSIWRLCLDIYNLFSMKKRNRGETQRKKLWQIVASLFPDTVCTPRQIWFENNHSQRIKNYSSAFSFKVYSQISNSWSNQNVQVILKWTHLPSFTSDKSRAWKWESEEWPTSHFPRFNSALIPRLTQVGAGLVEGSKTVRKDCISMCGITSEHGNF